MSLAHSTGGADAQGQLAALQLVVVAVYITIDLT